VIEVLLSLLERNLSASPLVGRHSEVRSVFRVSHGLHGSYRITSGLPTINQESRLLCVMRGEDLDCRPYAYLFDACDNRRLGHQMQGTT
jgi:hypothetical protein